MLTNFGHSVFPRAAGSSPGVDPKAKGWARLAKLWAVYYFAIYTIGHNPALARSVIWFGALFVGVCSLPVFIRHQIWRDLPREGTVLLLFSAWTLTGYFFALNYGLFYHYVRQIAELALIVLFVTIILKQSGDAKWFYLAFLGVAIYHVFVREEAVSLDQLQESGRIAYANTLGFNSFLGLMGALALMADAKRMWLRGLIAAGGLLALFGVVLSASRGALAATIVLVLLWAPLCLVASARFKFAAVLVAAVVLYLGHGVFQYIITETYMGARFTRAIHLEDGSSTTRLGLVSMGAKLFMSNPVFGCGVGQFGPASGRGLNAHNEFIEIAATTGFPGLLLYYSVFILAWKRLVRSLRWLRDPDDRYRINVAKVALLTLLISGAITRPNFLSQNTMFMLGVTVGVAHWAERKARETLWQPFGASPRVPPVLSSPWGKPGWPAPAPAANGVAGPAWPRSASRPVLFRNHE